MKQRRTEPASGESSGGQENTDSPEAKTPHRALSHGREAYDELLPEIYDELRSLAEAYLDRESGAHTLQATALVHEAWLRLASTPELGEDAREHFLALGAIAMRRVLVDHARGKQRDRRGGGVWSRVTLSEAIGSDGARGLDLVELDDLLLELEGEDERLARIVTLHLFGGLTNAQIARAVGVSERTVYKDWQIARAWLWEELDGHRPDVETA